MKRETSVVIVGAGPTGLCLANLLGQAGIDVLIVEAKDSTVSEPRAVSIDDESLRVVQGIGLLDRIEPDLIHGYGSEYRSPAGRTFLKVKPLARPFGHPRRNAFRQPDFEARLREGMARFPRVEPRFRSMVSGFVEHDDHVLVSLRDADGATHEVRAGYLIGCDGASSRTREQIGSQLEGSSLDEKWLIVDLENSPTASPETIVFCDPARSGIALPGPHRTRRYEFKLKPSESEENILSDESIAALLKNHHAAPESRLVRKTIYHFHARIADCWGRGRVYLAGDAAHLMPPFAGQGMNSGLRDAANLAWKLAAVIRGEIAPGLLATYEQERRHHVGEMIRLAVRMGKIMGPRSSGHGFATRGLFRALGLWPAARSYFAEMKYKPPPRFNAGFLLESMLSRRGIVGRMVPQPVLRSGPDAGKLLDDVLGQGFALLAIGVPQATLDALQLGGDWDRLIRARVAIPCDAAPELAACDKSILLLRPDRYVAARIPADRPGDVIAAANQLLAKENSRRAI